MKKLIIMSAVLLAAGGFAGCGGSMEMASKYSGGVVIIDGNDKDWEGKTTYLKDEKMLVGFQNDGENLYVMVSASDRDKQMQIMRLGLTFWFDEKGGTDKKFGVKYPVAMTPGERPMMGNSGWGGDNEGDGFRPEPGAMAPPEDMPGLSDLEIYEHETKSWTKMSFQEAKGIEAKIGRQNNRIVYELKISLKQDDNTYFLMNKAGKIGVGIETNEIDKEKMKHGMGRGGMGGPGGEMGGEGMGAPGGDEMGGGMGVPGGGRGGRGGMMRQKTEPSQFKQWFEVALAGK
ncbi:MAG TPA: hypothetical protein VHP30_13180 [Ignavibacteriales bacterium]|nr:hypothetical protein [Ignavibacteriales bacterium]